MHSIGVSILATLVLNGLVGDSIYDAFHLNRCRVLYLISFTLSQFQEVRS
jgi:hypothetical protein